VFSRTERMSDQPYQNTLHFLNAYIDMLNHSPVEHPRWHVPTTPLLLQLLQALQNDSFPMCQTISHIREGVKRITACHGMLLHSDGFCSVSMLGMGLGSPISTARGRRTLDLLHFPSSSTRFISLTSG